MWLHPFFESVFEAKKKIQVKEKWEKLKITL